MSSVDEKEIQDLLANNRTMPADDAAMIDWAFYYLNLGFTIFPLKPKTKDEFYPYPEFMNPDTGSIFSWKTQASRDPYRIYQFWNEIPDASIGAVTGELSGIYVLDLDREHTNHDDVTNMDYLVTDGWDRLHQWERETGMHLQDTWMDISGSGGNRLYYRADPSRFINSPSGTADIFNDSSGCDTRGNGRFVVLPPSLHPSGNRYEWELSHLPDEMPIAAADDAFYQYWKGSGSKAGRTRDRKGNILPTESFQPSQNVVSAARHDYLVSYEAWLSRHYPFKPVEELEEMVRAENYRIVRPRIGEGKGDKPLELENHVFPALRAFCKNDREEIRNGVQPIPFTEEELKEFNPVETEDTDDDLALKPLSEVQEKEVQWLVPGYIPAKQITLLVGTGGVGKTSVWCSLESSISQGWPTFLEGTDPKNIHRKPQTVMFFSSEDTVAEVLKGKIRKCRGNMDNFLFVDLADDKFQQISFGSKYLRNLIAKYKPALCVFDPLQSFIPANIKMSDRNAMRQAMNNLVEMGAAYGTTFIVLVHTNKLQNVWGRSRMADSSDIWDIARSVLMVGEVDHDKHLCYISHEKSNYGYTSQTVIFKNEGGTPTFYTYSDKKDKDFVREEAKNSGNGVNEIEECANLILTELKDGEMDVNDLDEDVMAFGYSRYQLKKAKMMLKQSSKISVKKVGFQGKTKVFSCTHMGFDQIGEKPHK